MTALEIMALEALITFCPEVVQKALRKFLATAQAASENGMKIGERDMEVDELNDNISELEDEVLRLRNQVTGLVAKVEEREYWQERCKRAEARVRELDPPPPVNPEELQLATDGQKIRAIKYYRERTGRELMDCKAAVEAAMNWKLSDDLN